LRANSQFYSSLSGGGLDELVEVDLAITIAISELHHLVDDIFSDVLTESLKEGLELSLLDDTITVGIHGGESLLKLLELLFGKFLGGHFGNKLIIKFYLH